MTDNYIHPSLIGEISDRSYIKKANKEKLRM